MKIEKKQTETYVLTELENLDPVTVYVTNYEPGKGKIVIECYGKAWATYWGGMSGQNLQEFMLGANNGYIINRMVQITDQTDFEKIEKDASQRGFDICATSDVELAMLADDMRRCFGQHWMMDLPRCSTPECDYLGRILNAVKAAFNDELRQAA